MKLRTLVAALATIGGFGWGSAATAAPVIGFDPCGGGVGAGCGFVYASTWSNAFDSGVDVGDSNPATALNSIHTFHSQSRVAAMDNNGTITTPVGMNVTDPALQGILIGAGFPTFELTKTLQLTDLLFSITGGGADPVTFNFTNVPQPTTPNLTIFYDALSPVDTSQAVPEGPTGAACYGPNGVAGVTTGAAVGCAADGFAILTANIISNTSSFTAPGAGQGTGQFDLVFEITFHDPSYLDLSNLPANGGTGNPIFAERMIGTLSQPFDGFPTPTQMWDGTPVAGNELFGVVSAQTFIPAQIPEPGSLLLMGLALAGLGAIARRRKI